MTNSLQCNVQWVQMIHPWKSIYTESFLRFKNRKARIPLGYEATRPSFLFSWNSLTDSGINIIVLLIFDFCHFTEELWNTRYRKCNALFYALQLHFTLTFIISYISSIQLVRAVYENELLASLQLVQWLNCTELQNILCFFMIWRLRRWDRLSSSHIGRILVEITTFSEHTTWHYKKYCHCYDADW